MNPAPPKPPSKTADRKALAAYFSELRRWAEALKGWEAELDIREAAFEQALEDASDETVQRYAESVSDTMVDEDDEDCDCDAEAAAAGCDCPKCENIRAEWVRSAKANHPKVTEDVKWLEDLWKLEDKRK